MKTTKLPHNLFLEIPKQQGHVAMGNNSTPKFATVKEELDYLRNKVAEQDDKLNEQSHILMSYENDAYYQDLELDTLKKFKADIDAAVAKAAALAGREQC